MVIQGEPGAVIRGKKGSGGVTLKKTGQALVIGIYDEPVRRILVRYGEKPWPDDVRSCAENYEVELVYAGDLANLLEPR